MPHGTTLADGGDPLAGSVLLRRVRLVPVRPAGRAAPGPGDGGAGRAAPPAPEPVDLRITDGVVSAVAPSLARDAGEDELDAAGRWAVPGLWDHHVHLSQWAQTFTRLDVSAARSAAEALDLLAAHLPSVPAARDLPVVAYGFRHATWADRPTLSALDAVAAGRAVVMLSGDVHSGWVSTRGRDLLGLPVPADDDGLVRENVFFAALARLADLPGSDPTEGLRRALADAAAHGVVGVTDLEWARNAAEWPPRVAAGLDLLRVRTATYADGLDEILALGLRTGDPLPGGRGLLTMGPLKVISDGSLNTATAHTSVPYEHPQDPAHPRGVQNVAPDKLAELVRRATAGGIEVAVHAIGDAAVAIALDAIEAAGARGSIEHAQLLAPDQPARFARLGVVASVQPAHLLDDRDVTERLWPGRAGQSFPLRSLLDAGARLALGSDAPVAPLDPWLAMAAAVHRSADERAPWHPEQHLTAAEALAASTNGYGTLRAGAPGDVVLLDADPLAPAAGAPGGTAAVAAHLRSTRVSATFVAGRATHLAL
ncbi:amidohydrolase family protein [Georgenia sp. EYE_87]|uniref:amidohydrolase n=1 Tax=Georgenia sp. EYE_87 TaxID=2853448 RepID=UPI0020065EC3|nr:amidohydrolase family protein [Georgenia sp. EYE_87]MCK6212734.1 amidohydrolase family protein [Georgenia sp. EYE_87]